MPIIRDRRTLALQVRDEVIQMVAEGHLGGGDRLATETELASRFGVARTTVREALKLLEQDGVIHVQHGVGRFVAAAVERPITRLESVTGMMEALGYRVTNRVLSVTEAGADADETRELRLVPGDPVVRLERLRLQGEEPFIYSLDVVPRALFGDGPLDVDWSGSLGQILASRGFEMASATAEIRAVTLVRAIARRIGWAASSPWLLMVQTNFTRDGRPIIYSHDYHRGDTFTFNVLRRAESNASRS
jgi:GntR family transcriptional regulator